MHAAHIYSTYFHTEGDIHINIHTYIRTYIIGNSLILLLRIVVYVRYLDID
jgi:hypothetical protein